MKDYGIEVHFSSEAVEFNADDGVVIVRDNVADTKQAIDYDMVHVVPPQSAPDWLAATGLADPNDPNGYRGRQARCSTSGIPMCLRPRAIRPTARRVPRSGSRPQWWSTTS